MEKKRESGEILEHMLLEEVKIENISFIQPPDEWNPELHHKEPYIPPVLIKEKDPEKVQEMEDEKSSPSSSGEEAEDENDSLPDYTLLAHHRSFWKAHSRGQLIVRAIVVRSSVQISLAHESVKNCIEEALLFDGLLRNDLCENRSRLSELLGYSRARITQILNLLKLPFEMRRKLLLTDDISEFQLRPIVRVSNPRDQKEMFQHLIKGKLTGRQMALFADERETAEDDDQPLPDMDELMNREESDEDIEQKAVKEIADVVSTSVEPVHLEPYLEMMKLRNVKWREEAVKAGVTGVDLEFLQGVAKLRNGLYREAVAVLQRVIEQEPEYSHAFFYMGKCYNLTGELNEAENALRTALELDPDDPDYLVELAVVLEKLKRDSEASSFYRKAGSIRKSGTVGESK